MTYKKRKQAPSLYALIDCVSKSCPDYKRWGEVVAEFIILATLSQSEPKSSQKKVFKTLLLFEASILLLKIIQFHTKLIIVQH